MFCFLWVLHLCLLFVLGFVFCSLLFVFPPLPILPILFVLVVVFFVYVFAHVVLHFVVLAVRILVGSFGISMFLFAARNISVGCISLLRLLVFLLVVVFVGQVFQFWLSLVCFVVWPFHGSGRSCVVPFSGGECFVQSFLDASIQIVFLFFPLYFTLCLHFPVVC